MHPLEDLTTVGRVHPADVLTPVLLECIVLLGEVDFALGVLGRSADIKRELELEVELIEERLRRSPVLTLCCIDVSHLLLFSFVRDMVINVVTYVNVK